MISTIPRKKMWAAASEMKIVNGWPEGPGVTPLTPASKGYLAIVSEIESIAGTPLSQLTGKLRTVYGSGGYVYTIDPQGRVAIAKSGSGKGGVSGGATYVNTGVAPPNLVPEALSTPKKSWVMPLVFTGLALAIIGGIGYKVLVKPKSKALVRVVT